MKITSRTILMASLCALSFAFVACEGDSKKSNFTMDDISGNWYGDVNGVDDNAILSLTEKDGKLSGSVLLNNKDTRAVSGSRNGNNVTINISGGERWSLVLKDEDDLDGTGTGKIGSQYRVDLDRK